MAEELRFHKTSASSITSDTNDAGTRLTNNTDSMSYIRRIDIDAILTAQNVAEGATIVVTKAATSGQGDGGTIPEVILPVHVGPMPAPSEGTSQGAKMYAFARGELTLEPGESLYTHVVFNGTGPSVVVSTKIWYHY